MEKIDSIKNDFRNFLYLAWKHLALPDPTPIQYDIAEYLQSGPKRLIIQALGLPPRRGWYGVSALSQKTFRNLTNILYIIVSDR